jgi:hypothetical protein
MADAQSSGNPLLITVPSYGDKALTNIAQAIAKSQGNAAQSDAPYTNNWAPLEPSKKFDVPAVDVIVSASKKEDVKPPPSNSDQFKKFISDWGILAVTSRLISPVYFDTYKYILQIPPPVDNISKADFNKLVDDTAGAIWNWYANAKYAGDLGALGNAILNSKPIYTPPSASASATASASEGFCPYQLCSAPPISIKETGLFILIVSLGLAGILAWKLGGRR